MTKDPYTVEHQHQHDTSLPSFLPSSPALVFADRGNATFDNINPATEELICKCPNAQPEDVNDAVAAARKW